MDAKRLILADVEGKVSRQHVQRQRRTVLRLVLAAGPAFLNDVVELACKVNAVANIRAFLSASVNVDAKTVTFAPALPPFLTASTTAGPWSISTDATLSNMLPM